MRVLFYNDPNADRSLHMKQRIHQAASSHQPGGNFFQLKEKAILKKVVAFGCILIALASSQLLQQIVEESSCELVPFAAQGGKPRPHLPHSTSSRCGAVSTLSCVVEWAPCAEKPRPHDALFHQIMNVEWCLHGRYLLSMHVLNHVMRGIS